MTLVKFGNGWKQPLIQVPQNKRSQKFRNKGNIFTEKQLCWSLFLIKLQDFN